MFVLYVSVTSRGGSSNMSGIIIYSVEGKGGDDLQHILMARTEARALGVWNRPSFHWDSRCWQFYWDIYTVHVLKYLTLYKSCFRKPKSHCWANPKSAAFTLPKQDYCQSLPLLEKKANVLSLSVFCHTQSLSLSSLRNLAQYMLEGGKWCLAVDSL